MVDQPLYIWWYLMDEAAAAVAAADAGPSVYNLRTRLLVKYYGMNEVWCG